MAGPPALCGHGGVVKGGQEGGAAPQACSLAPPPFHTSTPLPHHLQTPSTPRTSPVSPPPQEGWAADGRVLM
jgi:hypothetical protein